ncbi:ABC transporter permease [Nocardioides caldifontis]|uniref:ABC transporter permease n=1 Tax=Nocardioides caldifontis TaxID=2588938 RepID=UPI0011E034E2|nr:ABC transporter permease [Nocardioides caldifontis]
MSTTTQTAAPGRGSGSAGSSTPVWRVVAEREVTTRVRDKTFLAATGVSLLLVVGFFVVMLLLGGGADEYDVAVTSDADETVLATAQEVMRESGSPDAELNAEVVDDADAAEQLVRDGDVDVALLPADGGYTLVGDDEIDAGLAAGLSSAVASQALQDNAEEQGVDLAALSEGTEVQQRLLDPNADEADARSGVAFAFALVFLLTAMGFGMTIAQSVAQEKESRVVEILAAAVPVRALLWGKVVGNTVLAMGQILLITVVGVLGLVATGRTDFLSGISGAVVAYVVFFLLGFVALAALWSVAGALASRQEDLSSTTLPGQMLLFLPYFIGAFGSDDVRTVVSMLPIVSTMLMPGRMAEGDVPWWQIGVAVAVTVAAMVLFIRIGARMYERTLLRTGGKIGWGEALKASD